MTSAKSIFCSSVITFVFIYPHKGITYLSKHILLRLIGCRYATKPKSNIEFWETKIARNKQRDEVTYAHLEALGWTVIIVWECELRGKEKAEARIKTLEEEIRSAGELKKLTDERRRLSRSAAKRERELILERQTELEEEIKRMFPIPQKVKLAANEE